MKNQKVEAYRYIPNVGWTDQSVFLKLDNKVIDAGKRAELDVESWKEEEDSGDLSNIAPEDARKLLRQMGARAPTPADYTRAMDHLRRKDPAQYRQILNQPSPLYVILDGLWKPIDESRASFVNHRKEFLLPIPKEYNGNGSFGYFGLEDLDDETGLPKRLRERLSQNDFSIRFGKQKGVNHYFWGTRNPSKPNAEIYIDSYDGVDNMHTGGLDIRVMPIYYNKPRAN